MILEPLAGIDPRQGLRCRVPCKLNLFLEVLGRRDDGYHDLDTIMLAVDRCDELEIRPRGDNEFRLRLASDQELPLTTDDSAWSIPSDASNLILKALSRLRSALGLNLGADILLRKRIPAQAGLGGGSADAAAALVLGSLLWTGRYDASLASQIAGVMGSDINFFLEGWNGTNWTARCTGRGERVQPIPNVGHASFVIVHPPEGCDTASVFRELANLDVPADAPRSPDRLLQGLSEGDDKCVGAMLYNRLEPAAALCTDWIARSASRFDRYNPLGRCLTGSGSARFCLCSTREQAETIASGLRSFGDFRVYSASTWFSPSIEIQADRLRFIS